MLCMSSLCTNVPVQSMHIRDRSHAEWDHCTQLTLCSQCRYTVIQTMRSRSARRSPFTEWCWAEPFPYCVKMALGPMCVCVCVCVGNERVESQCSVLPQPAEVTMALNMIQKSLIVKYSNTSSTHVLTMEHHSKAIHWFMHQLSLSVPPPLPTPPSPPTPRYLHAPDDHQLEFSSKLLTFKWNKSFAT